MSALCVCACVSAGEAPRAGHEGGAVSGEARQEARLLGVGAAGPPLPLQPRGRRRAQTHPGPVRDRRPRYALTRTGAGETGA